MREQPFYRRFNDAWYVQVGKKQICLAKGKENRAEAFRRFAALIAGHVAVEPSRVTVAQACDLFLDHAQRHTKPKTYEFYKLFLQSFCDLYGTPPVPALKPIHVTRWLCLILFGSTGHQRYHLFSSG